MLNQKGLNGSFGVLRKQVMVHEQTAVESVSPLVDLSFGIPDGG